MQVLFLDFKNIHIYTSVVDCSLLSLSHFQVWGGLRTQETIQGLRWFIHLSFPQWCIIRKSLDRMRKGKIASVLWCSLWCCKTSQFWIGLNVRVELGLKIISCILNFTQRWAFALSNDRISLAMCLPNISKESSCFWLLLFRNTWALRPLFHLSSIF